MEDLLNVSRIKTLFLTNVFPYLVLTILYSYFMVRFKKYASCVHFELDLSLKFFSKFFDNPDANKFPQSRMI